MHTVADGVDKEKLVADARFLMNLWADINKRKEHVGAPALLHPDLDLILRATRDLFSEEVDKLVIDNPDAYSRVMAFIEAHMPALKDKVELYQGKEPIFDAYGIEDEIRRAQARKVWLKSGGYLIIDQAEALTAIDVNSGRYIGKKDLEETMPRSTSRPPRRSSTSFACGTWAASSSSTSSTWRSPATGRRSSAPSTRPCARTRRRPTSSNQRPRPGGDDPQAGPRVL